MTGSVQIPLYRRLGNPRSGLDVKIAETTVDAEDAEELQKHIWRLRENPYPTTPIYAYRNIKVSPGKWRALYMHRVILGLNIPVPNGSNEVDHLNRNSLDNRKANLRVVTRAQNHQNVSSKKGSTSKYRGVSWSNNSGKWKAQANLNKTYCYLGLYTDEKEAARVANEWRAVNMPYAVPQIID